ncbi:MAG: hydroxymethylglutaryl-CoA lyase, partial [Sphingomonadales bacterium]
RAARTAMGLPTLSFSCDAMQGFAKTIATQDKVAYLRQLLSVGFDTLDMGSFVSAKAIPQMADTADVLGQLSLQERLAQVLVIVANERGAREALAFSNIDYLGFPFSISETFQQRNTRAGRQQALQRVASVQEQCIMADRKMVVYLSMAFGNPYGDPYHPDEVLEWAHRLLPLGISIFSLADTVGMASPDQVFRLADAFIKAFPAVETGLHLHASPEGWKEKVAGGLEAGCTRFDAALGGVGGCPMATDTLVSNLPMEKLVEWLHERGYVTGIDLSQLYNASVMAQKLFA